MFKININNLRKALKYCKAEENIWDIFGEHILHILIADTPNYNVCLI